MKNTLLSTLMLLLLLVTPCMVTAATYYVTQNGSGDGKSYDNAMSVADHNSNHFEAGDTIYLCDTVASSVSCPSSGSTGKRIVYRGDYRGHGCIIDRGTFGKLSSYALLIKGKEYITIQDITVTGAGNGIQIQSGANYIDVKRCTVHDCSQRGIFVSNYGGRCTNITIGGSTQDGNKVCDCGINTASSDICVGRNSNVTVSYNECYGTKNDRGVCGIWIVGADKWVVEYNTVHDHQITQGYFAEGGMSSKYSSNGIFRYNHVYNEGAHNGGAQGINVSGNSHDIDIYGNYLHHNDYGIHLNDSYNHNDGCGDGISQKNIDIYNNIISHNKTWGIAIGYGGKCSGGDYRHDDIHNLNIYNNTITDNGHAPYFPNAGGISIRDNVLNANIKNNIFYNNTDPPNGVYQFYTVDTSRVILENNLYYTIGSINQSIVDWKRTLTNLTELKALGYEKDEPAGTEEDPRFTAPDNNDYTLSKESPCRKRGHVLPSKYAIALDPSTDWSTHPPSVRTADRRSNAFWQIGAYIYPGTMQPPSSVHKAR